MQFSADFRGGSFIQKAAKRANRALCKRHSTKHGVGTGARRCAVCHWSVVLCERASARATCSAPITSAVVTSTDAESSTNRPSTACDKQPR